jgi:hypothetical protein
MDGLETRPPRREYFPVRLTPAWPKTLPCTAWGSSALSGLIGPDIVGTLPIRCSRNPLWSYVVRHLLACAHKVTIMDDLYTGKREDVPKGPLIYERDISTNETSALAALRYSKSSGLRRSTTKSPDGHAMLGIRAKLRRRHHGTRNAAVARELHQRLPWWRASRWRTLFRRRCPQGCWDTRGLAPQVLSTPLLRGCAAPPSA